MVNSDPPPETLDSGWDDDVEEESGSTRIVDSGEVLARAISSAKATGNSGASNQAVTEHSDIRPAADLRATLPPPMPVADYVDQMMREAPESEHGHYRPTFETLHEVDPLQFDAKAPRLPDLDEPGVDSRRLTPIPIGLDVDAPFDLGPSSAPPVDLRLGSLAPDLLQASFDDLDELPVDEVLEAVSRRPQDLASRPTPTMPLSAVRAAPMRPPLPPPPVPSSPPPTERLSDFPTGGGLRLGGLNPPRPSASRSTTPPAPSPAMKPAGHDDMPQARPTNPGFPTRELLAAVANDAMMDLFEARASNPTPVYDLDLSPTADAAPEDLPGLEPLPELLPLDPNDLGLPVLEPIEEEEEESDEPDPAFDEVVSLFDAGSFNTALDMAESLLRERPNHARAKRCVAACQEHLLQTYLKRLGDRSWILRVAVGGEDIHSLGLDHRSGFLLSFIDGMMSIDEVLDVASMPHFDAARLLCDLKSRGVIVAEPP